MDRKRTGNDMETTSDTGASQHPEPGSGAFWPGTDLPKSSANAFTFDVPYSTPFSDDMRFRSPAWSAYNANHTLQRDRSLAWPEFRARFEQRKAKGSRPHTSTEVDA